MLHPSSTSPTSSSGKAATTHSGTLRVTLEVRGWGALAMTHLAYSKKAWASVTADPPPKEGLGGLGYWLLPVLVFWGSALGSPVWLRPTNTAPASTSRDMARTSPSTRALLVMCSLPSAITWALTCP